MVSASSSAQWESWSWAGWKDPTSWQCQGWEVLGDQSTWREDDGNWCETYTDDCVTRGITQRRQKSFSSGGIKDYRTRDEGSKLETHREKMTKIKMVASMDPEDIVRIELIDYLYHDSRQMTPELYKKKIEVAGNAIVLHESKKEVTQSKETIQSMVDEYMLKAAPKTCPPG